MKNQLFTVIGAVKNYGLIETFKLVISALAGRNGSILGLFALSEPKPNTKAIDGSKSHSFKFANFEDLGKMQELLKEDPDNQISIEDFNLVKNKIARCMVQFDGERLAGYTWVWNSHLALIVDGFHLNLPDDTLYNFKGYTAPDYRGFGYQAIRHCKLLELLKNEGIIRLFGYVDEINPRSLHGVTKSGYKRVGTLKVKRPKSGNKIFNLELEKTFCVDTSRF